LNFYKNPGIIAKSVLITGQRLNTLEKINQTDSLAHNLWKLYRFKARTFKKISKKFVLLKLKFGLKFSRVKGIVRRYTDKFNRSNSYNNSYANYNKYTYSKYTKYNKYGKHTYNKYSTFPKRKTNFKFTASNEKLKFQESLGKYKQNKYKKNFYNQHATIR